MTKNSTISTINLEKLTLSLGPFLLFLSLIFFNLQGVNGQKTSNSQLPSSTQTNVTPVDTGSQKVAKRNTFSTIFSGKPGRAALYSLVVPSGGQIYNKKWWKVPLALGIDGYFVYNLSNKYSEFRKYDAIVTDYNNGISHPEIPESSARNFRAQARTNREYAWVYLIVGHLVTVFDAYVDRHLLDFDISPDLTFGSSPSTLFTLSFPLNSKPARPSLP